MDINNYIKEMTIAYNKYLEGRLLALPVGYTLCVHEPSMMNQEIEECGDSLLMRQTIEAHILPRGELCTVGGHRTQYGPKE